jgi:hypothetical protein
VTTETPGPQADPAPIAEIVAIDPPPAPIPVPVERMDRLTRWMWILTAVGTVIRVLFVLTVHRPMDFDYSDMHSYIERARQMATPDSQTSIYDWYYPSGSAFFIHIWLRLFGIKAGFVVAGVVQALLASVEIPLLYLATARFFSRQVALGAAALFTFHYLSIGYAGFFMSENYLAIGLISACALFVPERPLRLLGAGLMLGLGAWAKSQAVLLAPLWAVVLFWQGRRLGAALVMLGCFGVVIPVSIYVSVKNHQPTFVSYNGGQTFALAHCPIREISYSDPISHTGAMFTLPVQNQRFERGDVEASWGSAHYTEPFSNSKFYMREGFKCIQRYPLHVVRQAFYHLADTFCGPPWSLTMPWPDSHTAFRPFSLISNLFVSLIIAPLAFVGLWWRRREQAMWLFFGLPVLSVLASAVLFHGDSRFRCPYDFCFFIAACAAVETWRKRREATASVAVPPSLPA